MKLLALIAFALAAWCLGRNHAQEEMAKYDRDRVHAIHDPHRNCYHIVYYDDLTPAELAMIRGK